MSKILEGKTAVIFGVANKRSIAWGIAQAWAQAAGGVHGMFVLMLVIIVLAGMFQALFGVLKVPTIYAVAAAMLGIIVMSLVPR